MNASAQPISGQDLRSWRERYRGETKGQIVHGSLHGREGWTRSHVLCAGGAACGYGSGALSGPWDGRPTVFEYHVAPEHRSRAFALFEALLAASGARHFEVQSNDGLLTVMLHAYGRDVVSEKIVSEDRIATVLGGGGALRVRETTEAEDRACIARRQGGSIWRLKLGGSAVARGGTNFHYNPPYADVYMEVDAGSRRRGLGSYLVQELKRVAYELGQIPCARCDTANLPSRRTLLRAGFAPCGHILLGRIAEA